MQFLSMHYWCKDINDKDGKEDMKLPFKKLQLHSQHLLFQTPVRSFQHQKDIRYMNPMVIHREGFIRNLYLVKLYRLPQLMFSKSS
ncbi:hypothetical protein [Pedobacter hartonius]|uniref:Uncharacterized protein n=1 Tax=Pedobacter hartonius TaxID=425514 RepID=A0A1H4H8B0_9SPHI|nr:hypothetical protein [Pedobacter hartonius]SEB18083.1 hypothetical protein SAMN05443550_11459 [Pedobacter hartonius]